MDYLSSDGSDHDDVKLTTTPVKCKFTFKHLDENPSKRVHVDQSKVHRLASKTTIAYSKHR